MHKFVAGGLDKAACSHCKRPYKDHSPIAQCEACPKIGPCELFGDMLLCAATCYPQELAAQKALKETAEQRVNDSRNATLNAQKAERPMTLDALSKHTQKIDQGIEMSSNIWNAKTAALKELIDAIDADAAVDNKPYARAHLTMGVIENFQKAIFDYEQQLVDARVGLRQAKTYLNTIINDLREEERKEFHIKSANYPAQSAKSPKTGKSKSPSKPKQSSKALVEDAMKWGAYLNVSGNAIHAMMISSNLSAKDAAKKLSGLMGIDWDDKWS